MVHIKWHDSKKEKLTDPNMSVFKYFYSSRDCLAFKSAVIVN